uniref:Uncharacterized protein n=1 Tax=Panagrolaimus sp. PS1159 TaxID=55785 RepID=A0AC35EYD1_9BILA
NHYSSGNHYNGNNGGGGGNGGRTRKNNNNHHGNNNWHQNTQSTSQSHQLQHVSQPRHQQVLPQTPVYMPQMGHVYVNQNAAITSSSSNNVVPINMIQQHYTMPQQVYQRIDANNMNGMVAIQPQQLQQNAIMVTPNMGMPQHQIHHGGPQIMHSQPPTPAPAVNHQGASPPMHFPPNLNVPPPPFQKKMVPRYAMQAPVVISNPSQIRITPLMGTNNKGPRMGMNNGGPSQYRRSG